MHPLLILAALGLGAFAIERKAKPAWAPLSLGKPTDPPFAHGAGVTFVLANTTTGEKRQLYGSVTDTSPPSGGVYTVLVSPDHNDPPAFGFEPGRMVEFPREQLAGA